MNTNIFIHIATTIQKKEHEREKLGLCNPKKEKTAFKLRNEFH